MLKRKFNPLEIMMGQAYFQIDFFKKHPQCKGCEVVEQLVMDYEIYPAFKESNCKSCKKYKSW